jgi:WD40 repeat protein
MLAMPVALLLLSCVPTAEPAPLPRPVADLDPVPPLPEGALRRIGEDRFRHDGYVRALALSADGTTAYTVAGDSVYAWDLATGRLKWRTRGLRDPHAETGRIAEAGDRVLVARADLPGPGSVLDRATGRVVADLTAGGGPAELWARLPVSDPRRYVLESLPLAGPAGESRVTFRDLGGVARPVTQTTSGGGAFLFAVSPDGGTVALNLYWRNTPHYSLTTGKRTGNAADADDEVTVAPLAFTPDGKSLVAACDKWGVRWTDVRPLAGGAPRRLSDHGGMPIRFSSDGKRVAVHTGHVWEVREFATARLLFTVPDGFGVRWPAVGEFTPDGERFVAVRDGKRLIVYDAATGAAAGPPTLPAGAHLLRWPTDGRLVALGDRAIAAWDPLSGRRLDWTPLPHDLDGEFPWADVSPAGDRVAYLTREHKSVAVADLAGGKQRVIEGEIKGLANCRFSPDGRVVAVRHPGGLRVADAASGRVTYSRPGEFWDDFAFTPDGRWLVAINRDATLTADLATGRETRGANRDGFPRGMVGLTGNRLAGLVEAWERRDSDGVWGDEGVRRTYLRVWHPATGRETARMATDDLWPPRYVPRDGMQSEDSLRPTVLAALPDGRAVAVGDSAGRVHLVELLTGKIRGTFHSASGAGDLTGESAVTALVASPDGRYLASAGQGSILVRDVRGATGRPASPPDAEALDRAWESLGSADAGAAFAAVRLLAAFPDRSVPGLKARRAAVVMPDEATVRKLIAGLDHPEFRERERAARELEKPGRLIAPALREAVRATESAEVRKRLADVIQRVAGGTISPDELRAARAVEAAEWIGTPEAVKLLEAWAGGAAGSRLTEEARGALSRIRR